MACGVWSPRIAEMAGATIPLTPAVHQMIDVGPIEVLQETNNEIGYPIVRDMDTFCYERQTGGSMEVGSYAHRPIFHHPNTIPSIEESRLSPTELPLTEDDFDPQLEQAIELMPMLGDAEIKYGINGLLSLTPDAMPLVGESVEVKNLWSCAAIWIKEGPGHRQGAGRVDDVTATRRSIRTLPTSPASTGRSAPRSTSSTVRRALQQDVRHRAPREQWDSRRDLHKSSLHDKTAALGRGVLRGRQVGAAPLVHLQRGPAREVRRQLPEAREHEWDSRWWSPIQNASTWRCATASAWWT